MWPRPRDSFKLYKESIIVLAFLINFRIHPKLDQSNITSANFVLKWILYVFHYFILNTSYLKMRSIFLIFKIKSIFLIFAIYRSKVYTSLKNKICFENTYFPSKFIKLCPESLKEHTDKIHWDRMKHKHCIEVSNICPSVTLNYRLLF